MNVGTLDLAMNASLMKLCKTAMFCCSEAVFDGLGAGEEDG